jgi:hypothetical protein
MTSPSRYDASAPLTLPAADGRVIKYLPRRRIAPPDPTLIAGYYRVQAGDRIDTIAAATLLDPELSWQLADANSARRPSELAEPGRLIAVPDPSAAGGSRAF